MLHPLQRRHQPRSRNPLRNRRQLPHHATGLLTRQQPTLGIRPPHHRLSVRLGRDPERRQRGPDQPGLRPQPGDAAPAALVAAGVAVPGPVAVSVGFRAHEVDRRDGRWDPEFVDDRESPDTGAALLAWGCRVGSGVEARAGHAPELEACEFRVDGLAGPGGEETGVSGCGCHGPLEQLDLEVGARLAYPCGTGGGGGGLTGG